MKRFLKPTAKSVEAEKKKAAKKAAEEAAKKKAQEESEAKLAAQAEERRQAKEEEQRRQQRIREEAEKRRALKEGKIRVIFDKEKEYYTGEFEKVLENEVIPWHDSVLKFEEQMTEYRRQYDEYAEKRFFHWRQKQLIAIELNEKGPVDMLKPSSFRKGREIDERGTAVDKSTDSCVKSAIGHVGNESEFDLEDNLVDSDEENSDSKPTETKGETASFKIVNVGATSKEAAIEVENAGYSGCNGFYTREEPWRIPELFGEYCRCEGLQPSLAWEHMTNGEFSWFRSMRKGKEDKSEPFYPGYIFFDCNDHHWYMIEGIGISFNEEGNDVKNALNCDKDSDDSMNSSLEGAKETTSMKIRNAISKGHYYYARNHLAYPMPPYLPPPDRWRAAATALDTKVPTVKPVKTMKARYPDPAAAAFAALQQANKKGKRGGKSRFVKSDEPNIPQFQCADEGIYQHSEAYYTMMKAHGLM